MPVLIGIDEAGYGPALGPLVVTSAAFNVPDEAADLWRLLETAVARTRRNAAGRLLVADSKVVYANHSGLADLERAVLAFMRTRGRAAASFRALTEILCEDAGALCSSAWWNDTPLPVSAEPESVESAAAYLEAAQGDARFLGFATQVVRAGPFNQLAAKYGNKSVLLFQKNMLLIRRAMMEHGGDLSFVIDKHGGRHYYGQLLANNFFGRPLRVLRQSPAFSSYEVDVDGRTLRLAFIEKADALHLPAALASMASKYVRELFMMCFNAYWCGRVEGLAPTAGYVADSERFIAAIRPLFKDGDEREVIRER